MKENAKTVKLATKDTELAMDLDEIGSKLLPEKVRRTRNTFELVSYLESGGQLTAEIRALIIDVLTDKLRASYRQPNAIEALSYTSQTGKRMPVALVVGLLEYYQRILANPSDDDLHYFEWFSKSEKFEIEYDTKGQRTRAAKKLLATHLRLTESQLSELLSQRTSRIKAK